MKNDKPLKEVTAEDLLQVVGGGKIEVGKTSTESPNGKGSSSKTEGKF